MATIHTYPLQPNFLTEAVSGCFSMKIRTWQQEVLDLPATGTHYGFSWKGTTYLRRQSQLADAFPIGEGMFFSVAEAATVGGEQSVGMVVSDLSYHGEFIVGGPVATSGRFAYIDGGMASLLIAPLAQGDPCLNALYMPPDVDQTVHTHPSDRIGLIIHGEGICIADGQSYSLSPGTLFHIPPDQSHKFVTTAQPLHMIIYHPDSDMGFTHRDHPMLRRTLINKISATDLPDVQTQLG